MLNVILRRPAFSINDKSRLVRNNICHGSIYKAYTCLCVSAHKERDADRKRPLYIILKYKIHLCKILFHYLFIINSLFTNYLIFINLFSLYIFLPFFIRNQTMRDNVKS